ncbi:MAG: nuclear transport factor 2 family protein [Actinomycetota bacterium]
MTLRPDVAERVAEELFAAFVAHDYEAARKLLADDFRGWGNAHDQEMDADAFLGLLPVMRQQIGLHRYEDVRRMVTGVGFVEQHRVRATLADGRELDFGDACVVARLDGNGLVERIDEYIDTARARTVLRSVVDG